MNDFTIVNNLEDLDDESKMLVEKAMAALQHAYAPYSNFTVATAVLLGDGAIVTGTNQENAAYPSGMCAERVALYAAASQHPGKPIKKLLVIARSANQAALSAATSCGPCRQVMLEYEQRQDQHFEIVMLNQKRQWVKAPSAESLLPFCFTRASLQS
jgi:cytidine deaminase